MLQCSKVDRIGVAKYRGMTTTTKDFMQVMLGNVAKITTRSHDKNKKNNKPRDNSTTGWLMKKMALF
jgi:hypothetical protein